MAKKETSASSNRAVRQKLESLKRAGVTHLPKRALKPSLPEAKSAGGVDRELVKPAPAAKPTVAPKATSPARPASRLVQLDILRQEVAGCVKCPQLASTRTQTVFGVGNPQARLCFFGEAPGADEDRTGEPFVGRAGQLLTKIIEACTLKREDVYILNVLKCRPPDNRPPFPEETTNCRGYFEKQFEIINPQFICCLGTTAAQALLQSEQTIGKLRGKFHEYRGAKVICTYHPSYLLRNPNAKKDVWEDMKVLMREMGIQLS